MTKRTRKWGKGGVPPARERGRRGDRREEGGVAPDEWQFSPPHCLCRNRPLSPLDPDSDRDRIYITIKDPESNGWVFYPHNLRP